MDGLQVMIFLFCAMMGATGLAKAIKKSMEAQAQKADPVGYAARKAAETAEAERKRAAGLKAAADYAGFIRGILKK